MKIENLKEGMTVKNYTEMCRLLEEPYLKSNSKTAQLREWERYFDFGKNRQEFIITKIYSEPLAKIENTRNKGKSLADRKDNYKIPKEYTDCCGVYKIQLDNIVYIGSTLNFKERFSQHHKEINKNPMTKQLLENEATYEMLYLKKDCDAIRDVRIKEQEFILQYLKNDEYIVINRRLETFNPKQNCKKIRIIKVYCEDIEKIEELFYKNNIEYEIRTRKK